MRRNLIYVALVAIALFSVGLLLGGSSSSSSTSGPWVPAGSMTDAREGSCAALLPDGRVLITGGEGQQGVLATAEFLGSAGEALVVPPMAFARVGHACVALDGGSVLVAGGRTSGGGELNSAEIYDAFTNSWRIGASMMAARHGATASLLKDGRVLIAGGEASGVAIATLETYDLATARFTPVPGSLSSPRKDHAAAVLKDGRVVIAGGSDGEQALASVDVFDPASGEIAPLGKMSAARAGLTATTLLDGRVFFAGGSDGGQDLASTETFDPHAGRFTAAASMDIPRRGHIALRIPNNNTVLIAGGTSAGEPQAEAGLYVPWFDSYRPHGVMLLGRSGSAATALEEGGVVVLAGGATKSAATSVVEASTEPTIMTDLLDYAPGQWVTISGANWTPTNTLDLVVKILPDRAVTRWQGTATVAADGSVLVANAFQMQASDAGLTFELTAVEQGTGLTAAAWVFTDANVDEAPILIRESTCSTNQTTFTSGSTVCVQTTIAVSGGDQPPASGSNG